MVGIGMIVYGLTKLTAPAPTSPVTPDPAPTYTPTPLPTPGGPTTSTPPTPAPSDPPTSGSYPRERTELTPLEANYYQNLKKGDCLSNEDLDLDVDTAVVVDCSQPHIEQVMGYVDLSEGMPDRADAIEYEFAVARRCNSLKATLPIPAGFGDGVSARYPDPADWEEGVRVALCWVPVFNTTWVGSALDGTAERI